MNIRVVGVLGGWRALAGLCFAAAIALPCRAEPAPPHAPRAGNPPPQHLPRAGHPPPPAWRGDIARFHEHDWGVWRGGRWAHQHHDGRLGWWWVVGGAWYFYPSPAYPYPNPWEPPPPVSLVPPAGVALSPPPTQHWYFCEASQGYYPYVATCPGGWKPVAAEPAPSPGAPAP